jgi:rare lipoprotein A
LPRPNISGRAWRALSAPLASASLAALFLAPAPAAAVSAQAPAGGDLLQVGGTASLAPLGGIVRVKLAFHRVHADLNVLAGRATTIGGFLRPARAGHLVELQRRGRHGWHTLVHGFTGAGGHFRLRYVPRRLDAERLRVLFPGDAASTATARPVGTLNVFRLAGASWYGGGGNLACGGWLSSSTLGVANRTLPCGTLVTLRYGHRSIRVPVIDRGPYVAGRDFDLTEATKRALGFEGVGEVWSTR